MYYVIPSNPSSYHNIYWRIEPSTSQNFLFPHDNISPFIALTLLEPDAFRLYAKLVNPNGFTEDYIEIWPIWCGSSRIKAYPNPVSNTLTIEIDKTKYSQSKVTGQLTFDIRLYNSSGNMVRQTKVQESSTQLDLSNLPVGVYVLHVYDGTNEKPDTQLIKVER